MTTGKHLSRTASRFACTVAAAACFACGTSAQRAPAQQQNIDRFVISREAAKRALTRSEISEDTAMKVAQACEDFAKQHNIQVAIYILSPYGMVVHARRMDGLAPVNVDTALYKAQTALYMRTSSHTAANRYDLEERVTRTKLNQYFVAGGLPIVVDDELIGAIGVGGSKDLDEQCAHAALTQVIGPQPPLETDRPAGANAPERRQPNKQP